MALKYQRPRGTHDFYPDAPKWADDSGRRQYLEDQFRALCRAYGYGEVRTPIFENTQLITRSVGTETDIVSKEMYTFETKGGDSLTLRPESTAPVLRAYVENSLHTRGGVVKLYYCAQHFRYERPQEGRYRQHEQLGVEGVNVLVCLFAAPGFRILAHVPELLVALGDQNWRGHWQQRGERV